MSEEIKIPKHIAFIMDGNGRWAKKRALPRKAGHKAGVKALQKVIEACNKKGVQMWNTNWPTEYSYANFRVLTIKSKNNTAGINSPLSNTTLHEGEGVVYYDLQGRKVSSPRQGVYIMRSTDGTTRKVLIK